MPTPLCKKGMILDHPEDNLFFAIISMKRLINNPILGIFDLILLSHFLPKIWSFFAHLIRNFLNFSKLTLLLFLWFTPILPGALYAPDCEKLHIFLEGFPKQSQFPGSDLDKLRIIDFKSIIYLLSLSSLSFIRKGKQKSNTAKKY